MGSTPEGASAEPGLQFWWYETKPGEELAARWGQLAGGLHRLVAVREDLEGLRHARDVEKGLRHLEAHVETYLVRGYELRERALGLLEVRTGLCEEVRKLRHPKQRSDALTRLKAADPELAAAVGDLVALLDADIGLRNLHTHRFYLNLGLFTGSDIFDPYDVLLDVSRSPEAGQKLEAFLRREVRATARWYAEKAESLQEATMRVLEAGDQRPHRASNDGI